MVINMWAKGSQHRDSIKEELNILNKAILESILLLDSYYVFCLFCEIRNIF